MMSALLAAEFVHRFGSRGLRRAAAWDCGFPDPNPATQYTGSSFVQPVRRILGSVAYRMQELVTMPRPGDPAPASFALELTDWVWGGLYLPITNLIRFGADQFDRFHYLTIRRYLGLVFIALVGLLFVVAVWR
jgi:hypothetical protein